jgi:hypothetical protein
MINDQVSPLGSQAFVGSFFKAPGPRRRRDPLGREQGPLLRLGQPRLRLRRRAAAAQSLRQDQDRSQDKLRELHSDLDAGVQTSASYTVDQAVADWMREGRDGRSPSTLRRGERILRPVLAIIGGIPLHALPTHDVRRALSELAASRSSATISLAHNCLVRAIRHAESGDHVRRNVAALVKPPPGRRGGRLGQ